MVANLCGIIEKNKCLFRSMQTRSDIKRGNAGMHPLFGKTHNMHLVHLQYAKLPSVDECNMTIYARRGYNMIYETLCVASDAYENIGNCDDGGIA